jgi:hypothetical protein
MFGHDGDRDRRLSADTAKLDHAATAEKLQFLGVRLPIAVVVVIDADRLDSYWQYAARAVPLVIPIMRLSEVCVLVVYFDAFHGSKSSIFDCR